MLNVFHNHLIRYIAAATAKIAACPEMPSPVRFAKMRKLIQQLERRLALEPLHQTADRHLRRDRYEQVDMVAGDVSLIVKTVCEPCRYVMVTIVDNLR